MSVPTQDRLDWSSPTDSTEPLTRAGLPRLTVVEMRKMIDTRSGFWLLVSIGLVSLAAVTIQLIWGDADARTLAGYFRLCQYPVGILLPVLGILTVTTEWSQRTALTTFTLVPERHRIVIAKLAAAAIYGALSLVVSLLFSVLGNGLGIALRDADGSWSLSAGHLGQALLFQVLGAVMGVGFGMLLMNSALAIVLYFMLPTVWQILTALISAIQDAAAWLDLNVTMEPLSQGEVAGEEWAKLGTSVLLWIVVPVVLGTLRLLRRELK
jgi:ABC-type transport system involved in multi-copper enzyme maturation permease subunit